MNLGLVLTQEAFDFMDTIGENEANFETDVANFISMIGVTDDIAEEIFMGVEEWLMQ
jgi:hypothetical protein